MKTYANSGDSQAQRWRPTFGTPTATLTDTSYCIPHFSWLIILPNELDMATYFLAIMASEAQSCLS